MHMPTLVLSVMLSSGCAGDDARELDTAPLDSAPPDTGPLPAILQPTAVVTGSQHAGRLGVAVVTLPDQDGDGRAEWVAAASAVGTLRQGAAWVRSGPPSDGTVELADATIQGSLDIERLGQAMASVGDMDGDGSAELVLGGIHLGEPQRMHGGVRVLWGDGTRTALTGDGMMEHAGWALDSSGPSREAVLVGTPYRRSQDDAVDARGFPDAVGRVYVLSDLSDGTLASRARGVLEGVGSWTGFGAAVAGTDLDGDGLDDALVGIPSGASAGVRIGRVAWFAGPLDGVRTMDDRDAVWEGAPGDHLGFSIDAEGDLDGDGTADILLGAYKAGVDIDDAGAVVVVDGATRQVSGRLTANRPGAMLGADVATRALADGSVELLAGAPGWPVDGARAGAVIRYSGLVEGNVSVSDARLIASPAPGTELGHALSAARDLDGDGIADLLAGAPGWTTAAGRTGAALFYAGSEL